MKTLLRWWYSLEYRVNMAAAYLASQMGEMDVVANHQCAALDALRRIDRLSIQP